MGSRIVIVSNRVAVPESLADSVAGGLAVAVKAALKNRNGLWFGWSGKHRGEAGRRAAHRSRSTTSPTP